MRTGAASKCVQDVTGACMPQGNGCPANVHAALQFEHRANRASGAHMPLHTPGCEPSCTCAGTCCWGLGGHMLLFG